MNSSNKIVAYKNNQLKVYSHENENHTCDVRFSIILPYIKQALIESEIHQIEFAMFLGDKYDTTNDCDLPYLSFSRHKEYTPDHILIPNIDFFSDTILYCISNSVSDIEFLDKRNSSIFAGANTNGYKRIEYCDKVKNLHQHIGLLTHAQMDKQDILSRYPDYDKLLGSCSIKEQLTHKVVVNIDGNGLCWSRLYWQMVSNSVPVYIDRKDYLEQYLEVDPSCYFDATIDNCLDVFDYVLDHNNLEEVLNVINNGQEFIKSKLQEYFINKKAFLLQSIKSALHHISTLDKP